MNEIVQLYHPTDSKFRFFIEVASGHWVHFSGWAYHYDLTDGIVWATNGERDRGIQFELEAMFAEYDDRVARKPIARADILPATSGAITAIGWLGVTFDLFPQADGRVLDSEDRPCYWPLGRDAIVPDPFHRITVSACAFDNHLGAAEALKKRLVFLPLPPYYPIVVGDSESEDTANWWCERVETASIDSIHALLGDLCLLTRNPLGFGMDTAFSALELVPRNSPLHDRLTRYCAAYFEQKVSWWTTFVGVEGVEAARARVTAMDGETLQGFEYFEDFAIAQKTAISPQMTAILPSLIEKRRAHVAREREINEAWHPESRSLAQRFARLASDAIPRA